MTLPLRLEPRAQGAVPSVTRPPRGPMHEGEPPMTRLSLLAATALLAAAPAFAQTAQERAQAAQAQTGTAQQGTASTTARAETLTTGEFTRAAQASDSFEIQSSRLVLQRSQNPQLRQFAQHMIDDHQKTTEQLTELMQKMPAGGRVMGPGASGSSAPGTFSSMAEGQGTAKTLGMDQQHQALLRQLEQANGAAFDRLYAEQQMVSHQQAVDMFANYAQSGDQAALRRWAAQTLPSLQEHLAMAKRLHGATAG